ncbi:MAG: hypothetical protein ABSA93_03475 [Streptosporangiaceae bacterium]|jgi:hypothetical protein
MIPFRTLLAAELRKTVSTRAAPCAAGRVVVRNSRQAASAVGLGQPCPPD